MSDSRDSDDLFGGEIFRYTRADAIRDGYLLDLKISASIRAGLRLPTVMTVGLWERLAGEALFSPDHPVVLDLCDGIAFAEADLTPPELVDQNEFGKLTVFEFRRGQTKLKVKLVIGPGDDGRPVATIMLPNES